MGDSIRRLLRRLFLILCKATCPGMIIYAIMLLSFIINGMPNGDALSPKLSLTLLIASLITAFITTLLLEIRSVKHAAMRIDGHLIGNAFGGWSKSDVIFCRSLDLLSRDSVREALEGFLSLEEYPMTDEEQGVLAFYTGRCYQILGCPSNAIPFYEKACRNGFSKPFAKLFQARSYADGGDFEQSYRILCDLLEHNPPKEFYFLYTDIGFLFIRQNKPQEAVKWFQKSIEQKQNYAFALSGMAIAALQSGDFAAAKSYRYQALINKVNDPSAFRSYFDETKALMLDEHPEWAACDQPAAAEHPIKANTSEHEGA